MATPAVQSQWTFTAAFVVPDDAAVKAGAPPNNILLKTMSIILIVCHWFFHLRFPIVFCLLNDGSESVSLCPQPVMAFLGLTGHGVVGIIHGFVGVVFAIETFYGVGQYDLKIVNRVIYFAHA